jgi:hypothetical protein
LFPIDKLTNLSLDQLKDGQARMKGGQNFMYLPTGTVFLFFKGSVPEAYFTFLFSPQLFSCIKHYALCQQQRSLTHSSPSGRFRPDKIADFLSLLNQVCALLKVDTAIGLYLCFQLQKTEPL